MSVFDDCDDDESDPKSGGVIRRPLLIVDFEAKVYELHATYARLSRRSSQLSEELAKLESCKVTHANGKYVITSRRFLIDHLSQIRREMEYIAGEILWYNTKLSCSDSGSSSDSTGDSQ